MGFFHAVCIPFGLINPETQTLVSMTAFIVVGFSRRASPRGCRAQFRRDQWRETHGSLPLDEGRHIALPHHIVF